MKYFCWDLDGTLADGSHRLHLLPNKENAHRCEAWDKFNLASDKDTVIESTATIFDSIWEYSGRRTNRQVIILTGRSEIAKDITEKWLADNDFEYDQLIMRPKTCHDTSVVWKKQEIEKIGVKNIIACWDDEPTNIMMMRDLGIEAHWVNSSYDPSLFGMFQSGGK